MVLSSRHPNFRDRQLSPPLLLSSAGLQASGPGVSILQPARMSLSGRGTFTQSYEDKNMTDSKPTDTLYRSVAKFLAAWSGLTSRSRHWSLTQYVDALGEAFNREGASQRAKVRPDLVGRKQDPRRGKATKLIKAEKLTDKEIAEKTGLGIATIGRIKRELREANTPESPDS